ncbi:NACHT, LRR and PYD domains-containing protein 12-like [Megalobrama amblycephala]|uniref:NACHT, LRR and PYD domains-containing protein 12-like n=1 Tax=Megalobrama amblycephala TaxID=75352 RepID=UPI00201477A1|nr:NACHT, LRR and PYD domains-containing protein 12-like [Megalobrama amblycephala]
MKSQWRRSSSSDSTACFIMGDSQGSRDGDFSPGCSSVQQKSSNPESSCVSMKSNCSMDPPLYFKSGDKRPYLSSVQQKSSIPESSCVSMKSNCSMDPPLYFKSGDKRPYLRFKTSSVQQKKSKPESSCVFMKSNWSMEEPLNFKSGNTQSDLRSKLLSRPVKNQTVYTPMIQPQESNENMYPGFSHDSKLAEVLNKLKSNLRRKFECLHEGISKQGNSTLLNEIYTELYITESESGDISNEHEVRQIEAQSRRAETEDTPIKCNDIFRPLPGQDKPIRTVLTKGVAGIGKTVSVQKFILDWAERKENQDVQLIFPLPFRELNLMKDKTFSLSDLLLVFFPETKKIEISSNEYKVVFIFDGLDECRLSLDFQSDVRLCDVSESASVDVLLTNLIAGNLLPSALIWITSRPAAADLIPTEYVHRMTEVRGFSDPQKVKYFRKRISDQSLAGRIITHLKSSMSLFIMCHIPVFCWISATVLEKMLSEAESGKIPKTLTQMYTHFLIIQTNIKHEKDYEKKVKDEDMIVKLGKLAYQQLVKGNVIFYEEDLRECGIDVTEASVYSGLCTQIFREELGLYQGKVFCFVHLSIQEHLAALYVHLSFINNNINVFDQITKPTNGDKFSLSDLHQRAVDEALDSKNGHLDLFLRFLLGLSLMSNQNLLQELMKQTGNSSDINEKTVDYIKDKISENPSPDKYINLFHCLNELGDLSLVNEAQPHMRSSGLRNVKLSSSQWSALVFVLLTSEQAMHKFNLKSFIGGEKYLESLTDDRLELGTDTEELTRDVHCVWVMPSLLSRLVVWSVEGWLSSCDCVGLVGADGVRSPRPSCSLGTSSRPLVHLRVPLTRGTVGVGSQVRTGMGTTPTPVVEASTSTTKDFSGSGCTRRGAVVKASLRVSKAWVAAGFQDRDLGLLRRRLGSGVEMILCGCISRTSEHCWRNPLQSSAEPEKDAGLAMGLAMAGGEEEALVKMRSEDCAIVLCRLRDCGVTDKGCAALASALRSNPSHLRKLYLSKNKLGDSGMKPLFAVLENPHCKLDELWLRQCGVTDEGCAALASALRSNPSHIRILYLTENKLGDSGVKLLSGVLENPQCKLEELGLSYCGVTDEGCAALASALRSNPSHLRELDLSGNKLGNSGVKLLSDLKDNPHYKLETLW